MSISSISLNYFHCDMIPIVASCMDIMLYSIELIHFHCNLSILWSTLKKRLLKILHLGQRIRTGEWDSDMLYNSFLANPDNYLETLLNLFSSPHGKKLYIGLLGIFYVTFSAKIVTSQLLIFGRDHIT